MKKKLIALAIVSVLSLGSVVGVYAATNQTAQTNYPVSSKAVVVTQSNETNSATEQSKEAKGQDVKITLPTGGIDQTAAEKIALASISGGTIEFTELEDENGVIVYSVEIKSGTNVIDVKIDALTGTILKSDQDNDKNGQTVYED